MLVFEAFYEHIPVLMAEVGKIYDFIFFILKRYVLIFYQIECIIYSSFASSPMPSFSLRINL